MMKDRSGCKRLSTTIAKDDGSFSLVRLEMLGERQFWPVAGEGSEASFRRQVGRGQPRPKLVFVAKYLVRREVLTKACEEVFHSVTSVHHSAVVYQVIEVVVPKRPMNYVS